MLLNSLDIVIAGDNWSLGFLFGENPCFLGTVFYEHRNFHFYHYFILYTLQFLPLFYALSMNMVKIYWLLRIDIFFIYIVCLKVLISIALLFKNIKYFMILQYYFSLKIIMSIMKSVALWTK